MKVSELARQRFEQLEESGVCAFGEDNVIRWFEELSEAAKQQEEEHAAEYEDLSNAYADLQVRVEELRG